MIFQEPMSSLNPLYTVGNQIVEAIRAHRRVSRSQARKEAIGLLDEVRIPNPELRIDQYPHQLSGGQRQRVMIAMALANNPDVLIADEPTTALDVTVQAQILNLLRDLQKKHGMAVMLITHDLTVVRKFSDYVYVMQKGALQEHNTTAALFEAPKHPYTRHLWARNRAVLPSLSAIPNRSFWRGAMCAWPLRCAGAASSGRPITT